MKKPHWNTLFMRAKRFLPLLALVLPSFAHAQGTLPIALQQQFSFTNCQTFTNACGTPLQGGLLYFYQVGTVATVQNSFQDTGLTLTNPWPLTLDANGRIPLFYLANGAVHVRLTDASGVVQFDIPNALVIGPSSGGGGGGGSVDPTTVLSTGDVKFRMTQEFVTGWVRLNAQTIGGATSGATQRANADTQNLFVYLWNNCLDAHCPVVGGRGASGLADFTANKQLTLPDWRGRGPMGVDDMGNSAAGRIFAQNVTSGGGDGVTTAGATGGEALHTMLSGELASHVHGVVLVDPGHAHANSLTDPGHLHGPGAGTGFYNTTSTGGAGTGAGSNITSSASTASATTGITINNAGAFTGELIEDGSGNQNQTGNAGSASPFNQMQPFLLGSWYCKL